MEDDVRPEAFQDVLHIRPVLELAYDRHDRRRDSDSACLQRAQFPVYLVDGVFAVAEQVQALDSRRQQLPGYFRAYRSARPRNDDAPAREPRQALSEADGDGAPAKQVLGVYLARLHEVGVSLDNLGDVGNDADPRETGLLQ